MSSPESAGSGPVWVAAETGAPRQTDHEGHAVAQRAAVGAPPPSEYCLTLHVGTSVSWLTIVRRSRRGPIRWNRREGMMRVEIGRDQVERLTPPQVARLIAWRILDQV